MIFEALHIRENPDMYVYMEINIIKKGRNKTFNGNFAEKNNKLE